MPAGIVEPYEKPIPALTPNPRHPRGRGREPPPTGESPTGDPPAGGAGGQGHPGRPTPPGGGPHKATPHPGRRGAPGDPTRGREEKEKGTTKQKQQGKPLLPTPSLTQTLPELALAPITSADFGAPHDQKGVTKERKWRDEPPRD